MWNLRRYTSLPDSDPPPFVPSISDITVGIGDGAMAADTRIPQAIPAKPSRICVRMDRTAHSSELNLSIMCLAKIYVTGSRPTGRRAHNTHDYLNDQCGSGGYQCSDVGLESARRINIASGKAPLCHKRAYTRVCRGP